MRTTFTRDFYIPLNSTKVVSKICDAVAYLHTGRTGKPCATMFYGKQAKPAWSYAFTSEAARAKAVADGFARKVIAEVEAEKRRDARRGDSSRYEVGHVLVASWGYEQTNVNFYQVTAIVGAAMIEVRPIGSTDGKAHTSMSGTVLPVLDKFTGEPMRRRAGKFGVRIDSSRHAGIWNGKPMFESSWH